MLTTTYKTLVHAQPDTVWGLLVDSLDNPQRYLPGIEESKVIARSADEVVREMKTKGMTIRERVAIHKKEWELDSEFLEHPLYRGTTAIRLVPTSVQNPMAPLHLEVNLRLERRSFHLEGMVKAEEEMVAGIRQEMETLRAKAEEMEQ
jgi:ribosome-associated toxin RatA of RatAB toxin-antitoxin module